MFLADVVHVTVEDAYMDQKGNFRLEMADPIVYCHGSYHTIGKALGNFGYSVRKQRKNRKAGQKIRIITRTIL
jgi:hypothetical protein